MSERPKRSGSRPDYRQLSDVKVPKYVLRSSKRYKTNYSADTKLYRLRILEKDEANGVVKVGYIGYSDKYNEWRRLEDIVNVEEGEEEEENNCLAPSHLSYSKFCLFEELACRIKSLLISRRKSSPVCSVTMSFDLVHFESLVLRGIRNETKGKNTYSLTSLLKLDDLLGKRWYIRGINEAGDFCYIEPGTVSFYLKQSKPRPDFQLTDDGTLVKHSFGKQNQLIFQFVRSDGISCQWDSVLQSCT